MAPKRPAVQAEMVPTVDGDFRSRDCDYVTATSTTRSRSAAVGIGGSSTADSR